MAYQATEPSKPKKETKGPIPEVPDPKEGAYLPSLSDTVSSSECTGLIPSPPENGTQMASYQELSSTSLPDVSGRSRTE